MADHLLQRETPQPGATSLSRIARKPIYCPMKGVVSASTRPSLDRRPPDPHTNSSKEADRLPPRGVASARFPDLDWKDDEEADRLPLEQGVASASTQRSSLSHQTKTLRKAPQRPSVPKLEDPPPPGAGACTRLPLQACIVSPTANPTNIQAQHLRKRRLRSILRRQRDAATGPFGDGPVRW